MIAPLTGQLGPIQPSDLGFDPLDISVWIGIVAPFFVALLLRTKWSRQLKFWITVAFVLVLSIFAWWTTSYPANWELISTQFAVIFGVSQMVFNALKPTGIFEFLETKTDYSPKHSIEE